MHDSNVKVTENVVGYIIHVVLQPANIAVPNPFSSENLKKPWLLIDKFDN